MLLLALVSLFTAARIGFAIAKLTAGLPDDFLALPLCVIIPGLVFFYLVRLPGTASSEGLMMRLAALILILLIICVPAYSLHLALGFPFAFLVVELFETRFPKWARDRIKQRVIA